MLFPISREDGMNTQKQLLRDNCGQTCVAMLAGVDQWGAMHAVGNDHGTSPGALQKSLEKFGFICERKKFTQKEVEEGKGIGLLRSKVDKTYGHAVVYRNGCIEDPALGVPIKAEAYLRSTTASGRRFSGLIAVVGFRR